MGSVLEGLQMTGTQMIEDNIKQDGEQKYIEERTRNMREHGRVNSNLMRTGRASRKGGI